MSVAQETVARLRGLEGHLRAGIRGQDHLLPRVAAAFCRGALALSSPDRPRASFLFVGPTGTGKTETFTRASDYVCGPGRLLTFDMSEYQDRAAVNKLLGESRDDSGLLGRALHDKTDGALLFDEVEKAHPLVLDLFLQILWQGRITLTTGQTLNVGGFYVGVTSNIGSSEVMRMERSKFSSVEQAVLRSVDRTLRPEFVGRIDEKLVFAPLSSSVQREIAELEVARETSRLRGLGYDLVVSKEALELMIREGFHPQLGARPLRKTIERTLQDAVAQDLFLQGIGSGTVTVANCGRALSIFHG